MPVTSDHPLVADYLRRLDEAAAGLPAGRRGELVEEIRGHVADALLAAGDDEPAVRGVLDRLGSPEEIVAAEREDPAVNGGVAPAGGILAGTPGVAGVGSSALPIPGAIPGPIHGPVPGAIPGSVPGAGAAPFSGPGRAESVWGPVEIFAVLGLTVGMFVVPVVGPIVGLVCAWVSTRWTRREKVVATAWTALAPLVMVLAAGFLFAVRSESSSVVEPVVVEQPAEPFGPPEPVDPVDSSAPADPSDPAQSGEVAP